MHIAICDDTKEELSLLQESLHAYAKKHSLKFEVSSFESAQEILDSLKKGIFFDLYLLDVVMPGIDGIELGTSLRELGVLADIIYITAVRDFAADAFRVKARDYLLKPIDQEILFSLLDEMFEKENAKNLIMLVAKKSIHCINIFDIVTCKVQKKALKLNLANNEKISTKDEIEIMLEKLAGKLEFMMINDKQIINFNYVETINDSFIIMKNNQKISIKNKKSNEIKQA